MTTILAVTRDGRSVVAGDGQVTLGQSVQKHGAVKVRAVRGGAVVAGFAGGAADALALLDRFEGKLEEAGGQLLKAAVELAKEWRTDRALRRLEAALVLADATTVLLVSGNGDVVTPDDGVLAAGSGGPYAAAAARALLRHTPLSAKAIAEAAMKIAGELDLYTNDRVTVIEVAK